MVPRYAACSFVVTLVALGAAVATPSGPRAVPQSLERRADDPLAAERARAERDPSRRPVVLDGIPHLGPHARFDAEGAHIVSGGTDVTLGLRALGREGAMHELGARAALAVEGAEVRLTREPGVVEWWRSLPSGLEQGVTLGKRAPGTGPLALEMDTGATVRPERSEDGNIALRSNAQGRIVARYAELIVLDRTGARMPARLDVRDGRILIEVDDRGARYPLVVDPLFVREEAILIRNDAPPYDDELGLSVALSADARVAVASVMGGARVFVRDASDVWRESDRLAPPGAPFIDSIAISANGSRVLLGAARADGASGTDVGSVLVYTRTTPGLFALEATLFASDAVAFDYLGEGVALDTDGSRALVGMPRDDHAGGTNAGSARVFSRGAGGTWSEEATLVAGDAASADFLGSAVALSADGARALVGAPRDNTTLGVDAGSARVYTRGASGTWTENAALTGPPSAIGEVPDFASAVALSADGARAIVGAPYHDADGRMDSGSAWVFTRDAGGIWTSESRLVAASSGAGDRFGGAVALSATGAVALVGAERDSTALGGESGSARVLSRAAAGAWTEEAMLLGSDGEAGDRLGTSVALADDASRALVGVPFDNGALGMYVGSARVFVLAPLGAAGAACTVAAACTSGACVDGVCCTTACGGGATNDCEACANALTGVASGTCAPVRAATTCRAAVDVCDEPEVCDGSARTCPPDRVAPSSVLCRAAVGTCDAAEVCSGTGAACPLDAPAAGGVLCRPATPGGCDVAEVCDGAARTCPGDAFSAPGVVCRALGGMCDVPEVCDGSGPDCPADLVSPAAMECRPSAGPCDIGERCDAVAVDCPPDRFDSTSVVCDATVRGVCDAPDHCTGDGPNCPDAFLASVECRAAAGTCDVADLCSGTSASCPADTRLGGGIACRGSSDPSCDPVESCDGVSASCPLDVTSCTLADGGRADAGSGTDAGTPAAVAGCSCTTAGSANPWLSSATAILFFARAIQRRRRS